MAESLPARSASARVAPAEITVSGPRCSTRSVPQGRTARRTPSSRLRSARAPSGTSCHQAQRRARGDPIDVPPPQQQRRGRLRHRDPAVRRPELVRRVDERPGERREGDAPDPPRPPDRKVDPAGRIDIRLQPGRHHRKRHREIARDGAVPPGLEDIGRAGGRGRPGEGLVALVVFPDLRLPGPSHAALTADGESLE